MTDVEYVCEECGEVFTDKTLAQLHSCPKGRDEEDTLPFDKTTEE